MESALHQLWVCSWGSVNCRLKHIYPSRPPSPSPAGWTITALNAAPSWNWYEDRSLGAGEGGEQGWRLSWRCWAVAWASRPQWVTWHILRGAERIIVQAYLCVLGSGHWATLIREPGTHTAGRLQSYIFRWVSVRKCINMKYMHVFFHPWNWGMYIVCSTVMENN